MLPIQSVTHYLLMKTRTSVKINSIGKMYTRCKTKCEVWL